MSDPSPEARRQIVKQLVDAALGPKRPSQLWKIGYSAMNRQQQVVPPSSPVAGWGMTRKHWVVSTKVLTTNLIKTGTRSFYFIGDILKLGVPRLDRDKVPEKSDNGSKIIRLEYSLAKVAITQARDRIVYN